jgi:thioredoxin-related protein
MSARFVALILLLALAPLARAASFLTGYDEAPTLAKAFEQVRAQPEKHVLIYVDMSRHCPPCAEVRAILNSDAVREQWRRNYVVVSVDLYAPSKEERDVIEQLRVSWAPVLVFLDRNGRRVSYTRELRSDTDARLLNEFVSQRQYATSAVARYGGQHFDARAARYATQARVQKDGLQKDVQGASGPSRETSIDDRPRLQQVLAHKPERLAGAALKKAMIGKVMHKENQDWFLDLQLDKDGTMQAAGRRKHGGGSMQGTGKWYVTKKGKLCLELTAGGVDENWCRHVFKVGEGYYVSKDLRPERVVYRFVLDER